jgi:ureidoglycolate hydrolase
MKLNVEKLEKQTAGNWYRVLTKGDGDTGDKKDFLFNITSSGLNLGNSSCTGLLTAFFREERVTQMERHLETEEILVALDGDSIVCLAPPGDLQSSAVRAFSLPQGKAVVMGAGTWHWIPFPQNKSEARFLVIFKDQTGEDDLEIRELEDNVFFGNKH